MKFNLIFTLFFSILFVSCTTDKNSDIKNESAENKSEEKKPKLIFNKPKSKDLIKPNLEFLKKHNDQYAFDIDLLNIKELRQRMIQLVGEEKFKFIEDLSGNSPIKIRKNIFSSWHYRGSDACCNHAIIVIDFNKNLLCVGICTKLNYSFYTEDGSSSETLYKWYNHEL